MMRPLRISSTSGSRSGSASPSPRNGTKPPHGRVQPCRAGAELRAAKVARLRGEHQLDRDHARAELGHLVESPRGERRHRHPVLDPLRLRRRDEVERDGLREEPRLDRDRLDRDPVLAERALGHVRLARRVRGQPGQVLLQHLHGALGRASRSPARARAGRRRAPSRAAASRSCRPRRRGPRRRARAGSTEPR